MLNYKHAVFLVLLLCSCGKKPGETAGATADSTTTEVTTTNTVAKSPDFESFLAPFKPISFPSQKVEWFSTAKELPRIEQRLALKFVDRDNMDTSMFNQSKFMAFGKVMETARFIAVIHVTDTGDGISYELVTYTLDGKQIAKESVGGMPSYGEISELSTIDFKNNVLEIVTDGEGGDPGDPDPNNVEKWRTVTTIRIEDGRMTAARNTQDM